MCFCFNCFLSLNSLVCFVWFCVFKVGWDLFICKHGSQDEPYTVSLTTTYVKCVFPVTIPFR